jgi:hypothetical protein
LHLHTSLLHIPSLNSTLGIGLIEALPVLPQRQDDDVRLMPALMRGWFVQQSPFDLSGHARSFRPLWRLRPLENFHTNAGDMSVW